MTDFVNTLMLIAASVGALAFGVLAAYGVLRVAFTLMRPERLGVLSKPGFERPGCKRKHQGPKRIAVLGQSTMRLFAFDGAIRDLNPSTTFH
jgi:hypothetical protein